MINSKSRTLPLSLILIVSFFSSVSAQDAPAFVEKHREHAMERWEKEIEKFDSLNSKETHPADAILFTGSSSIRRWDSIEEDMKPWPVIRRGYGGARFSDLVIFIDRIIQPHQYDALAIFVANDISGGDNDKSPEEVLKLYQYIVDRARAHRPDAPIFFIAITPTSSRFKAWSKIRQLNEAVRKYSEATEGLHFIATESHYLDEDGKPRDEYFVKDLLHLNEKGYDVWAKIIKKELSKVLGARASN